MRNENDYWNYGERYPYDKWKRTKIVAGITFRLPKKPPKEQIANYELPAKEQYFRPPNQKVVERINMKFQTGEEFSDDEIEFMETEWDRRRKGFFFFNNGYLEYVTGLHYFYISAWKIPIGASLADKKKGITKKRMNFAKFSDSDRDRFYWWEYGVEKNPNCVGGVEVTRRRGGKTHKGNVTNFEMASRTPDVLTGIQSKTGPDAKAVFRKLVDSWKKLPEYFKPVDVGESDPGTSLRFKEPSKKTTKTQYKNYTKVLNTEVGYQNARETAYDGWDLAFYFMDEAGKTKEKEANVRVRWEVVRETMSDGASFTGKALITTTVEDMEKDGGANLKVIWDKSDPNNLNEINQTESGLIRIFNPAYYGFRGEEGEKSFIDKYGYSNLKAARDYLERRRATERGASLTSLMRKYPFTVEEAFRSDNKFQILPDYKIYEQKDHNIGLGQEIVIQGDFIWKDGIENSQVIWHPHDDGRWFISRLPPVEIRNKRIYDHKKGYLPGNIELYCSGCDPFDHSLTTDNRKSNAASHVIEKFNILDPYRSNSFVSEYIYRQPDIHYFYDDMLKQCVFYGSQILVENNKPGLINYFKAKGYANYLMDRPEGTHTKYSKKNQKEKGIPLSGSEARQSVIEHLESYIFQQVGLRDLPEEANVENPFGHMYFERTMDDWLVFDPKAWNDYDATVSTALTVIASKKFEVKKPKKIDIGNMVGAIRKYA